MVHVAVRVHRGMQALAVPAAHRLETQHVRRRQVGAGIHQHQALPGVHCREVDEGLEEGDAGGELLEQARSGERVEFRLGRAGLPAPELIGAFE